MVEIVESKAEAGMMVDASGNQVPVKWVPAYDKLRDKEVRKVVKAFAAERVRLEGLMAQVLASVDKVKNARGKGVADKGNIAITSFNGLMRMEIVTRYKVELDDRAMEAKKMMVDYVTAGLADVKDHDQKQAVLQLINDTFTQTSGGCLRSNMVVRLLNYKILAKEWQSACLVLREAMQTYRSKSYINVSVRRSTQDDWQLIRLDLADCWPQGYVVE